MTIIRCASLADQLRADLRSGAAGIPARRKAAKVLDMIFAELNGREWDSSTASEIAYWLENADYVIEPPAG